MIRRDKEKQVCILGLEMRELRVRWMLPGLVMAGRFAGEGGEGQCRRGGEGKEGKKWGLGHRAVGTESCNLTKGLQERVAQSLL